MNIESIKKINFKNKAKNLFSIWEKYNNMIFIVFFCVLSTYGAFLIYQSLYDSTWNENQKKEYILSQQKNINFNEGKLMEIIDETNRKRNEYEKNVFLGKDIFIQPLLEVE
ncbi:MAG: hypothetical protein UR69_C0002G0097 [Candidatus Moranbacteria bacterium GW2011_GWE2_35_2-]|nr:MAG: hypothetical protein UR69_C0002G0097 [Candidatus Moranbacteria bacterium GW2011_GWE2_35_2-]KKQ04781.1 MAG: hypothetical protein US15_C0044G0001 [Candidatus Moranbacteria bacterium GW2011_GWF1_36_4]KKQ22554.1 MAG: hypothetical protein US37_C0002G0179 [Candidatus Moranbacteria bacterium GW2011_GWF2_37_11]KKQ28957.1 MAG: hypothetical protein US44_C0004G0001 [Candidatus Moranbacteria bacterium GW2011_GWD1_37_17]KKQ30507.1 MAG: hypothetical protein US47_C0002G0097 [Candidatus Moranbacteria b